MELTLRSVHGDVVGELEGVESGCISSQRGDRNYVGTSRVSLSSRQADGPVYDGTVELGVPEYGVTRGLGCDGTLHGRREPSLPS